MHYRERLVKKYPSATYYILSSLIPYTEANLKLSFKPSMFFSDLEKLDSIKANKKSLKASYYRLIQKGLIEINNGVPKLTEVGLRKAKTFKPKKLKGAKLMIIFDIPEKESSKRQQLRLLLRELAFVQIQKSVWMCEYDHREYIRAEIAEHTLESYIELFEARSIS
jgi:DNA-binding transcriptional regulator PaaX